MLATYQAKFVDNQIQWIDMPTNIAPNADIIVTVLPAEINDKQTPNNATSVGLGTKMASYFKDIPPAQSEEENLYIPARHLDMELEKTVSFG